MREAGWDAFGVEPSAAIAREAHIAHDHLFIGRLEDAPFERASFDLVTFWDVIEHVPDPIATLRAARAFLKPSGRLLVETQNVKSLVARVLRSRWHHYKHAEHLFHFHRGTLAALLECAGFQAIESTSASAGKYVSGAFIAERAARLSPLLSRALSPLSRALKDGVYVNLFDEMIVLAEPLGDGGPKALEGWLALDGAA